MERVPRRERASFRPSSGFGAVGTVTLAVVLLVSAALVIVMDTPPLLRLVALAVVVVPLWVGMHRRVLGPATEPAPVAENSQQALAEALRDTAMALTGSLDLSVVLERILTNLRRVLPYDAADVMLVDKGEAYVAHHIGYERPGLQAAITGLRLSPAEVPSLRMALQSGQRRVVPNIKQEPEWVSTFDDRIFNSYICAPIRWNEQVIGFLNLFSVTPNCFDSSNTQPIEVFANQAGIAIQNARLFQQVAEVAAFEERQRLARDLHDAVSQTLFAANVITESLPRLWAQNPERAFEKLVQLSQLTRGAMAEMRALLLELRPAMITGYKLSELLVQMAEAVRGRREITFVITIDESSTLPEDVHIALYRIAQESLNNVVKHSQATDVEIVLLVNEQRAELTIIDNGVGFDEAATAGFGMNIMRERADRTGATFQVRPRATGGTEVRVTWAAG